MPQIVWTATPDGTITSINRPWTLLAGLTLEQTNQLAVVEAVFHEEVLAELRREPRRAAPGAG